MSYKVVNKTTGKLESCFSPFDIVCERHENCITHKREAVVEHISSFVKDKSLDFIIVDVPNLHPEAQGSESYQEDYLNEIPKVNPRVLYLYAGHSEEEVLKNKADGKHSAYLEYSMHPEHSILYIDYMRAEEKNSGFGQALLTFVYENFLHCDINWGDIVAVEAGYLYNKFARRYGRSYAWLDSELYSDT